MTTNQGVGSSNLPRCAIVFPNDKNGYNERFNGTLRREVHYAEWFSALKQADIVIQKWLKQYNYVRPHQALGMRAPVPETLAKTGT
ncbi:MAG: transposase [Alphaproteobacteria bacterium]|nr:MAG: transposase [Alphaproteobacteria bacterium]